MSFGGESISQVGSGLVFSNSYGEGVTPAFRAAIVAAEHELQANFTNSVTVEMHFDMQSLGAGYSAQNTYALVGASYADFSAALAAHATTASDQLAIAALPQNDPSHGVGFWIPSAEARVLGLSTETKATDDSVLLNSDQTHDFGKDTIATLEHEITEGVFGRVGSLGITQGGWQPMDLFRFTADGARDYTGGADGKATFFGIDAAHVTNFEFHNAIGPSGLSDGGDLADWETTADAFGPGGPGYVGALSPTDLQALDVLGWTPAAISPAALPATATGFAGFHDEAPAAHSVAGFWSGCAEF